MAIDSVLQAVSRADYGFRNIPVIDMKDADSPDPVSRQQLARDIRDACINVGFFYVKNHGIPEESALGAIDAGKKFFALPEETKLKYDVNLSPSFKGYNGLLRQNVDPENRGDLHEAFNIGPELNGQGEDGLLDKNRWPSEVDGFKEGYLGYYEKAVSFGKKLFRLFALSLELSEDFFDDKTKCNNAVMRVIRYPPQYGTVDDRVIGIGAHTDFECFTMLWQEPGVEALQVLNANKEWVAAPPIPGTLVINIGDQLSRWTNDVFRSTVHRAINRSGVLRHSMPVFVGVDYNVLLEPIPSCVSAERPLKYKVITAGEQVKERLDAAYGAKT